MKKKSLIKNRKGSVNVEFLGMLPYLIFFFLLMWQVVISGYTIYLGQTAVSESAKVYAVTGDQNKAEEIIEKIAGSSSAFSYEDFEISRSGPNFEIAISGKHSLIFVPEWLKGSYSITHHTYGRVL